MKTRTVIATVEIETDLPMSNLRKVFKYAFNYAGKVRQIQTNVIKPTKRAAKKK